MSKDKEKIKYQLLGMAIMTFITVVGVVVWYLV
jgi:hypothetical protein